MTVNRLKIPNDLVNVHQNNTTEIVFKSIYIEKWLKLMKIIESNLKLHQITMKIIREIIVIVNFYYAHFFFLSFVFCFGYVKLIVRIRTFNGIEIGEYIHTHRLKKMQHIHIFNLILILHI